MRARVSSVVDMVINFRCQGSAGSDDLFPREGPHAVPRLRRICYYT